MSITTIREGLAARLATISGWQAYAVIPDNPVPPCAIVGIAEGVTYDLTMRSDVSTYRFPVRVLAARVDEASAQHALDEAMSPAGATSVRAAVGGDRTLGGAAHTTRVVEARQAGVYDVAGQSYLGVEILVEVIG